MKSTVFLNEYNEVDPDPAKQELAEKIVTILRTKCAPYLNKIGGLQNAPVKYPLYFGVNKFKWDEEKDPIKLMHLCQN